MNSEMKTVTKLIGNIDNILIKERVENLIFWDIKSAIFYKRSFYLANILIIIINASIPIINQIKFGEYTIIVSLISAFACVLSSLLALGKIKDNWIRYRKYAELLKRECFSFITLCSPYDDVSAEKNERLFIKIIESISADENTYWEKIHEYSQNKD